MVWYWELCEERERFGIEKKIKINIFNLVCPSSGGRSHYVYGNRQKKKKCVMFGE